MPSVKRRASKILDEYGAVRSELIGKAVVLTDGKAGTVENVWLDELHGLYETNTHERLILHLRAPANVPTTQFWAVDVCDAATAGFIRESPVVGPDSYKTGLKKNADGTVAESSQGTGVELDSNARGQAILRHVPNLWPAERRG